jgi:hypothetical protein
VTEPFIIIDTAMAIIIIIIRNGRSTRMSDNNNDGSAGVSEDPRSTTSSIDGGDGSSTGGNSNTKELLEDLKRDQEEFYSRISKIAQSEIAASPPYNKQFEKILQNSAKRIADIDRELKKLEEKQGDQKQAI